MKINNSKMIRLRTRTIGTFTALLALAALSSLSAKEERFPLAGVHVEIPLESVGASLTLSLFLSEGNLTVEGRACASIGISLMIQMKMMSAI